jgi:hypothetical protein
MTIHLLRPNVICHRAIIASSKLDTFQMLHYQGNQMVAHALWDCHVRTNLMTYLPSDPIMVDKLALMDNIQLAYRHDFNPQPLAGCHEPWGWVDSKDKSLQDVFTKEMHSKFDIDLKGIGTNVDLSLNINSPRKGQTHLMGTMTHHYHGMLRLLKWNNLGKFFYSVEESSFLVSNKCLQSGYN